jgi:hypothetical protein
MVKKVLIGNIEFRSIALLSDGAETIAEFLVKLNRNNAKTVTEIFTEINIGRRRGKGIHRNSILRTVNSLRKYEADKIKCKAIKGIKHYWFEISNSTPNLKPKKILKTQEKELLAEIHQEKILEKDLYPEVKEWLNNYSLDGVNFRYMVNGGAIAYGQGKFSNPDIIGINIQGNHALVVSVEVKHKIDNESELIGFAQCCGYKLFSDYVFFFCYKPNTDARAGRLMKMCQYYGIGLKFLDNDKIIVPAVRNDAKIGDTEQKHLIIEKLNKIYSK